MKKVLKLIIRFAWILLPVGFVLGMAGYMLVEDPKFTLIEAFYASGALFFVNPVSDANNELIMAGKIIALIGTASFIVSVVNTASEALSRFWVQRWADSTAVYSDNAWGKQLARNLNHGYEGRTDLSDKLENTKCHVIMFSDDITNLKFYQEHYASLENSDVYIMLNRVDAFLMDRPDQISARVHFFNLYDLMARVYWQRHHLYDVVKTADGTVRVAIIGYGDAGKSICKYAILNNIYAKNQRIEYHIWGCSRQQGTFLTGIDLMNNDSIIVHDGDASDDFDVLRTMDRIILTEEDSIGLLQEMLLNIETQEVGGVMTPAIHYCFGEHVIEQLFDAPNLVTFGDMEEILTEEYIKGEILQRMAKLFNYDYYLNYSVDGGRAEKDSPVITDEMAAEMERIWTEMDGFLRGSNIARADHYWIEKRLLEEGCSTYDMQHIEHSRWSRYHTYNHWTRAEDGKKDRRRRKHHLLVPFEKLEYKEQSKDFVASECIRKEIDSLLEQQLSAR